MDLQSLVAAHITRPQRPRRMSAAAEDRYYADQIAPSRPSLRLLGPLAAAAGAILLLLGVAQV